MSLLFPPKPTGQILMVFSLGMGGLNKVWVLYQIERVVYVDSGSYKKGPRSVFNVLSQFGGAKALESLPPIPPEDIIRIY